VTSLWIVNAVRSDQVEEDHTQVVLPFVSVSLSLVFYCLIGLLWWSGEPECAQKCSFSFFLFLLVLFSGGAIRCHPKCIDISIIFNLLVFWTSISHIMVQKFLICMQNGKNEVIMDSNSIFLNFFFEFYGMVVLCFCWPDLYRSIKLFGITGTSWKRYWPSRFVSYNIHIVCRIVSQYN
jgi:hypothetical protein